MSRRPLNLLGVVLSVATGVLAFGYSLPLVASISAVLDKFF